jgi:hypothetical protein
LHFKHILLHLTALITHPLDSSVAGPIQPGSMISKSLHPGHPAKNQFLLPWTFFGSLLIQCRLKRHPRREAFPWPRSKPHHSTTWSRKSLVIFLYVYQQSFHWFTDPMKSIS